MHVLPVTEWVFIDFLLSRNVAVGALPGIDHVLVERNY